MNVTTHPNGTTLPGPGFRPSQLAQRKRSLQAKPKDCLLQAAPDKWASGRTICTRAGLNPGSRNYSYIKALVAEGKLESRSVKHAGGFRVQYRRNP